MIQYPRALGAVDVVVELVDFHTQVRLQNPTIFRIFSPTYPLGLRLESAAGLLV